MHPPSLRLVVPELLRSRSCHLPLDGEREPLIHPAVTGDGWIFTRADTNARRRGGAWLHRRNIHRDCNCLLAAVPQYLAVCTNGHFGSTRLLDRLRTDWRRDRGGDIGTAASRGLGSTSSRKKRLSCASVERDQGELAFICSRYSNSTNPSEARSRETIRHRCGSRYPSIHPVLPQCRAHQK